MMRRTIQRQAPVAAGEDAAATDRALSPLRPPGAYEDYTVIAERIRESNSLAAQLVALFEREVQDKVTLPIRTDMRAAHVRLRLEKIQYSLSQVADLVVQIGPEQFTIYNTQTGTLEIVRNLEPGYNYRVTPSVGVVGYAELIGKAIQ
jgi:hypothetical protein